MIYAIIAAVVIVGFAAFRFGATYGAAQAMQALSNKGP